MPFIYTKKKSVPKKKYKTWRRKKGQKKAILYKPQKGLRPAMHTFKRQIPHQVIHINRTPGEGGPGAGWITTYQGQGYIAKLWQFKLSDFNFVTDFTNLFGFYKLNAVHLKIYQATGTTAAVRNNSQCLLTLIPGRDGEEVIDPPQNLECKPARIDKLLLNNTGRAHSIFMKLNQLKMTYAAAHGVPPSATNYALKKPSYVSTKEPDTMHYGIWTYVRSVNGTAFDDIQLRIEPTIYLSCKQVE